MAGAIELFSVLSTAIARDAAPPGMRGRVAIGVRSRGEDRWWVASIGDRAQVSIDRGPPAPEADALLLMDEREASRILGDRVESEPGLLRKQGDEALLERFFARYLIPRSMIDIRADRGRK